MTNPTKKQYFAAMMAGFGAISLSIVLFFFLLRLQGIGAAMTKLGKILAPFIYGGVVAYLLRPVCNSLESFFAAKLSPKMKKFANPLAVGLSLLTGMLIVYAIISMIVPQLYVSVTTLWNSLPGRLDKLNAWVIKTFGEDERLVQFANKYYEMAVEEVNAWVKNSLAPQVSSIVSGVGASVLSILRFLYNLLVGLIVAVYLLAGRKKYSRQCVLIVKSMLPKAWADMVLEEVNLVDRMFGGFIDGKIMDSAIVGLLCYIGCSVLRFPNALLISVIIGITNIIPFFGPFIGAVPSTLLILMENPLQAVWFVVFILVLQQLDGNVIGPRILGDRTGLSGFWVLFSIIFFGGLWGVVGMVICVPLFAVIYDLVKKLVCRGLKRHENEKLWEQYKREYPDDSPQVPANPPQETDKKS